MTLSIKKKLIIINLLNITDLYLTFVFLNFGMIEINPIMDYLFSHGLGFVKIFIVLFPSLLLLKYENKIIQNKNIHKILMIGIFLLLFVNLYNIIGFLFSR